MCGLRMCVRSKRIAADLQTSKAPIVGSIPRGCVCALIVSPLRWGMCHLHVAQLITRGSGYRIRPLKHYLSKAYMVSYAYYHKCAFNIRTEVCLYAYRCCQSLARPVFKGTAACFIGRVPNASVLGAQALVATSLATAQEHSSAIQRFGPLALGNVSLHRLTPAFI